MPQQYGQPYQGQPQQYGQQAPQQYGQPQQGHPQHAQPQYAQPQYAQPQQGQQHGGYPHQQQPSLGTGSRLNIHTGFFPLAWILFFTGPVIIIDGVEVGRKWGNQVLDLAPGVHTIHIHTRYLWDVGSVDQQFQIAPGQQINVSYDTPFWMFSPGKIVFH